jgi:two-component system, NarL family, sensor histidine kinase UhpB
MPSPPLELTVRTAVNLAGVAVLAAAVAVVHPERFRVPGRVLSICAFAVGDALLRGALQIVSGVYSFSDPASRRAMFIELISTFCLGALSLGVGLLFVGVARQVRRGDLLRLAAQQRVVQLLREVQDEELRVRRELAETIHGTVQGTFVVIEAQLHRLAEEPDDPSGSRLRALAAQLGTLREGELRRMSAELYPVDLDRGPDAALLALLARLPSWVAVTDDASAALADVALSQEAQVLIIRVVEDGLSNALRHGRARAIRVAAAVDDKTVTVSVSDDGVGPAEGASRSGLARLGRRAEAIGGTLRLEPGDEEGALLTLVLPR